MGILDYRFRSSIPSLQIPLSNASSAASRLPTHGSGPGRFAIPSLYDSCIRYSMPVYPGAIQTSGLPHKVIAGGSVISVNGVSKTFDGKRQVTALEQIDLQVARGGMRSEGHKSEPESP